MDLVLQGPHGVKADDLVRQRTTPSQMFGLGGPKMETSVLTQERARLKETGVRVGPGNREGCPTQTSQEGRAGPVRQKGPLSSLWRGARGGPDLRLMSFPFLWLLLIHRLEPPSSLGCLQGPKMFSLFLCLTHTERKTCAGESSRAPSGWSAEQSSALPWEGHYY